MASSYESTTETTNTNRVCRVILGPCTDGLRDILRHYVPPPTFPHVIKVNKKNLPRLTAVQRDLILPQHGSYTGSYDDMDITLLYLLLRNITAISPHSKGWGNDPDPSDRSLSANIERVRLIRNKCYGHPIGASMTNTEFHSTWSTIRSAMVDVDAFLNNGIKYQKEMDFLRLESMDPELGQYYENELRKQVEEDRTTRKMLVDIKRRFGEETKNLHVKVAKLTESPIPPNVREQYDIDIQKWREEDKLYYETHSFPTLMQKVRNQPYVMFVGVPGSGKSATAHHIALKLQEEGYEIVPTKDVRKMEDYGDPKNPQVFVVDDVVGVFGLQETKLNALIDYEQKITNPCMDKSRTLMTIREAVFNEALPYKPFLTKEETVIKFHSSGNALNKKDKKQILQKYGLNVDQLTPALRKSASRKFPLLCKLFSKETKFQASGSKFFLNPVQCILDEIDDIQSRNKLNYATLVLCMLNENSLSEDILKDRKNKKFITMKIDTLENCRLEHSTDSFKFMDALSAMKGTYTKRRGARYTFMHDYMFEICAYHYGKQFPDQMLLYMSSSYVANYVKPQTSEPDIVHKMKEKQSDSQSSKGDCNDSDRKKENGDKSNEREESVDLCVRLREDQYPRLAERLYRDIQNMELYDVFRNQILKHPQVCQAFIGVLEKKHYRELKSLFLSNHGEVDKLVSKRPWVVETGKRHWMEERHRQILLMNEMYKKAKGKPICCHFAYNVRVISWAIYYGHYQIVQYIVQQTEQHNEISKLFEITGKKYVLAEKLRLLTLSCYSGDVQTVKVLLPFCQEIIDEIGQNREDYPLSFDSPLEVACVGGHAGIVEELVKTGVDVDLMGNEGNTPLIAACYRGHVSVVRELVKARADVNQRNGYGNTPLIAACEGGHVSVVEKLVKVGADVNIQDGQNTPLIAAVRKGSLSIVKHLVEHGADWITQVVVYTALTLNKPDIVKYII